jgi:hypothetical protein
MALEEDIQVKQRELDAMRVRQQQAQQKKTDAERQLAEANQALGTSAGSGWFI